MQKQLGIRMQAKRAAMLAENVINIKDDEEEEEEDEINEVEDDSMDTTNESNDANSEVISTIDKVHVNIDSRVLSNEPNCFFFV